MDSYINKNLTNIKSNIKKACIKADRNPAEITLLGATKNVSTEKINTFISLGELNIGENKVQELIEKYDGIDKRANFHFIGKLQTNKVKYIIDKVNLIHSIDSLKLATEVNKRAASIGKKMNILIEINIAGEKTKQGILPKEAEDFSKELMKFENINIVGLMTLAPFDENSENNREYFRNMKKIFIDINNKNKDNISMEYLSMGMSNDYEIAIEEGANIVRIGSALFGKRSYL